MSTFGVIPTYEERQRPRLRWDALFAEHEIPPVALALVVDAQHSACGGWQIDGSDLICECGEKLFVLWRVP